MHHGTDSPERATPPSNVITLTTAHLQLLGEFQLSVCGAPVTVGPSAQRLLALLALHQRPISRSHAAGLLWPDTTDTRAHANLRTAVYRLGAKCSGTIDVTATRLSLARGVTVDVRQIARMATDSLSGDTPPSQAQLVRALNSNLHQDILPGWDEEWLRPECERFKHLRLHFLEALCRWLLMAGRHGAAVDAALAAVQGDPFRETAHETLIRAFLAEGNRNEAVQHYLSYRRMLRDELGLEPPQRIGMLLRSA